MRKIFTVTFLFVCSVVSFTNVFSQKSDTLIHIPLTFKVCGQYFTPKEFIVQVADTSVHQPSPLQIPSIQVIGYAVMDSLKKGIGEFIVTRRPAHEMEFMLCPTFWCIESYLSYDSLSKIERIEIEVDKVLFPQELQIDNQLSDLHYLATARFIDKKNRVSSIRCSESYKFWEKGIRKIFRKSKPLKCEYKIFEGFKIICMDY